MMQVESFPSEYQSTGWGMIEGTSQLGNFLSPFIVSGAINLGINPLIIFSVILAVLGLAPLKFLKETLKSRPQDALL